MKQILAQKGKAYDKLPQKTLDIFDDTKYLVSTKYDGNQIFIVKEGNTISMFTSDWKEFHISLLAMEYRHIDEDFVLVGEFLYRSDGKLGSRGKSAVLTTFRTNFKKGWLNGGDIEVGSQLVVFDYLPISNGKLLTNMRKDDRLTHAFNMLSASMLTHVINVEVMTGKEAKIYTKTLVSHGWEGTMLDQAHEHYQPGKRVNYVIKLKDRLTADLECIDVKYSEINPEDIGSLILKDSEGRICAAGGLPHALKKCNPNYFIGKIIEIKYEQILDTYIQPVFECIRDDKSIGE